MEHELFAQVKSKETVWVMGKCLTIIRSLQTKDNGQIHITLQKMLKGESWLGVFKGHEQLNPLDQEELKKKLMLERFQEEVFDIEINVIVISVSESWF